MAKGSERIKTIELPRLARSPGMHCDGKGLYLKVGTTGSASWVFRYMLRGSARTMGLGAYPERSLRDARRLAMDARRMKMDGRDPLNARRETKAEAETPLAVVTFRAAALELIESKQGGWRDGGKTAAQWNAAFRDWVYPVLGDRPVIEVDELAVLSVLTQPVNVKGKEPTRLWEARPETASRIRARIENVLSYAKSKKYRSGDNPADWETLKFILPKRGDVKAVEHHPAMNYRDLPAFMAQLRSRSNVSRLCLEFTILSAARTNEVLGMPWGEVNFEEKVWTIPASRMKGKTEHRVPLTDEAIKILQTMQAGAPDELVFKGLKPGKGLSNNSLRKTLQSLAGEDVTTHGFRSTFSTWARERTNFPREIVEASLAHVVGTAVEQAYARTTFFDKRRELMGEWAQFSVNH